jgi:ankyrin repeat protein
VPNFEVAGFYDMSNGDMLMYQTMVREGKTEAARKGSRIIIGPWGHVSYRVRGGIDFGPHASLNTLTEQIRWFDYWLKGIQNGVDKDPPVRLFVMGDNEWRNEQHWPLQRSKDRVFYIASAGHANTPEGDGRLLDEKGASPDTDTYTYDPSDPVPNPSDYQLIPFDQRRLAQRKDILVYQTQPLTERFEVVGDAVVELYAASTAPDTDWFVRLIDVYPDGLALNVAQGIIRARYREGLDKSELIKPGETVKYTIRMTPTSNAFLPGHRIRLDITSSCFPYFDCNHNTAAGGNVDASLVTAQQTIHHGGEEATRIILPWIPNPKKKEPASETKSELEPKRRMPALHLAAADGDAERMAMLLSQGADVDARDGEGRTPLHYAAKSGKKEAVKVLLEACADINVKDDNGLSPLHWAAQYGRKSVAELLIAKGADVNAKDNWGATPASYALSIYAEGVAKLILEKAADNSAKDLRGLPMLHAVVVDGYRYLVELLLCKGANVDERDERYEFTALHYAARFGNKDVAEVLIAYGADIRAKDKWGYQPIHWAAYHDRPEIIELLIAKGADVNAKTSLGQTPLELAKPRRNTAAIEVLRKHGARE